MTGPKPLFTGSTGRLAFDPPSQHGPRLIPTEPLAIEALSRSRCAPALEQAGLPVPTTCTHLVRDPEDPSGDAELFWCGAALDAPGHPACARGKVNRLHVNPSGRMCGGRR